MYNLDIIVLKENTIGLTFKGFQKPFEDKI